jgi:hypothetical protein
VTAFTQPLATLQREVVVMVCAYAVERQAVMSQELRVSDI